MSHRATPTIGRQWRKWFIAPIVFMWRIALMWRIARG
jgi:hypothetical protein